MILQKLLPFVYWSVATGSTIIAFSRGGRDEQAGSSALLMASLASAIAVWTVPVMERLTFIQTSIFAIDAALLLWFVWLALRSKRFWPLWASAFSLIVFATHVAHFATPSILPRAYVLAQGFWAYPTWLAILIGTAHHWRSRTSGLR